MSEISKDIGTIIDPEQSFEEQAKNLTSITQEAQRSAVDLNFEQDFQDKAIQDELQARRDRELRVPFEEQLPELSELSEFNDFDPSGILNNVDRDYLESFQSSWNDVK